MNKILSRTLIAALIGSPIIAMIGLEKLGNAERRHHTVNNPVFITGNKDFIKSCDGKSLIKIDRVSLYNGNGRDRSRGLEEIAEIDEEDLWIVRDLLPEEKAYAEVSQNYFSRTKVTLHLGPTQDLPKYQSLGNGGNFEAVDTEYKPSHKIF